MRSVLRSRTWPDGTVHRGRVLETSTSRVAGRVTCVQIVEDLTVVGEAHVLIRASCCDRSAKAGDEGTLEFRHDADAPFGGDWKFTKDPKPHGGK